MTSFHTALAFVLTAEGSWSADPNDRGNWTGGKVLDGELIGTKYGISAAAYPGLDIPNLTLAEVEDIYHHDYWLPIRGDEIPAPIAMVTFDCAVNHGVDTAIRLLQRVYGSKVDGIFGPRTLAAILAAPIDGMVAELCARRAMIYSSLAEFPTDGLGWMRRLFRLVDAVVKGSH